MQGRVRNTNLPKSHGLQPIFEAVVNSIHALEDRKNLSTSGKITLQIKRDNQSPLDLDVSHPAGEIKGFIVEDNGLGFNDANLKSFETLDSEYKIDKGCRGVGRLLWLKAFRNVNINSVFEDSGARLKNRIIKFDVQEGVKIVEESYLPRGEIKTCVHLEGFEQKYSVYTPKTIDSIAHALLEHCLWYFVRPEGIPLVTILDTDSEVNLNDLYDDYMCESAYAETIKIKEYDFDLTHIKFRASSNKKHGLALCASNRLVIEENINGKITGLHGKISDDKGEFAYCCYVSSPYLDKRVRAERTSFDIEKEIDGLFSETEISLNEIREKVLERSKVYLEDYLKTNIKAGQERVNNFIDEKAPRYRSIVPHIEEEKLAVDPNITDKELDLLLHKQYAEIERGMLEQGHEIMTNFEGDFETYKERLFKYLKTAEDIKKSDLANYVSHRRVIIDLMEKAIQRTETGKYEKEELIHKLIMPMQMDSNASPIDTFNLWLVDERLAFHNYLASDRTLNSMPITGDTSTKEPDICALNVCDNPLLFSDTQSLPLASITVIEIKRPMRNDAKAGEEKDPIEQALGYLNRIRNGKVKTFNGRPIPNSKDIPGYCYIICDLTESIVERCRFNDLTPSRDHLGFFGYHKFYKAYIEVISFDKLVKSAKERNRAFFDKLGLPTN